MILGKVIKKKLPLARIDRIRIYGKRFIIKIIHEIWENGFSAVLYQHGVFMLDKEFQAIAELPR